MRVGNSKTLPIIKIFSPNSFRGEKYGEHIIPPYHFVFLPGKKIRMPVCCRTDEGSNYLSGSPVPSIPLSRHHTHPHLSLKVSCPPPEHLSFVFCFQRPFILARSNSKATSFMMPSMICYSKLSISPLRASIHWRPYISLLSTNSNLSNALL